MKNVPGMEQDRRAEGAEEATRKQRNANEKEQMASERDRHSCNNYVYDK